MSRERKTIAGSEEVGDGFAARAFLPLIPPGLPSATADGFFGGGFSFDGSASGMTVSTIELASC